MPDVFVDGEEPQEPTMQRMMQPIDGEPAPTPGVDAPPVKAPSRFWIVFVVAAVIIATGLLL